MQAIEIIQGTMQDFGGYKVDGVAFIGEEFEMLVDEAKEIAYATGRAIEDVLANIIPA